ncbi:hypothetical protein GALL_449530 [mine drainage metagenome]|uniref:Uncharacterized protein n=1 Tax=mine drainage metagenome TaxID=410659 RepID=A0A1J5PRJ1_9ZZZZ
MEGFQLTVTALLPCAGPGLLVKPGLRSVGMAGIGGGTVTLNVPDNGLLDRPGVS